MQQDMRIIKRYTNRRLYDTTTSRYITLDDIQELVLKQIQFKIVDNKTEEDLTAYILLQIISEQENKHFPLFTTEILQHIIRFYGNPLQKNMTQFLEQCFTQFSQHVNQDPLEAMNKLTKQNLDMWQTAWAQYFQNNKK